MCLQRLGTIFFFPINVWCFEKKRRDITNSSQASRYWVIRRCVDIFPAALALASGLAATVTITHMLKAGDGIVCMDDVYGGESAFWGLGEVVSLTAKRCSELVRRPKFLKVWLSFNFQEQIATSKELPLNLVCRCLSLIVQSQSCLRRSWRPTLGWVKELFYKVCCLPTADFMDIFTIFYTNNGSLKNHLSAVLHICCKTWWLLLVFMVNAPAELCSPSWARRCREVTPLLVCL